MRTAPLSDDLCPLTGITGTRTHSREETQCGAFAGQLLRKDIFLRNTPQPSRFARTEGKPGAEKRKQDKAAASTLTPPQITAPRSAGRFRLSSAKLPAVLLLHRNIVFFYLPHRRYPVQTTYFLMICSTYIYYSSLFG